MREERERPVVRHPAPGAGRPGEGHEGVQDRVAARPAQRHAGPLDREQGAVDPGERAPTACGPGPPGGLRLPGGGGRAAVGARRVDRTAISTRRTGRTAISARHVSRTAVHAQQVGRTTINARHLSRTAVRAQQVGRTTVHARQVSRTAVRAQQVGRTAVSQRLGGGGVRVAHRVIGVHGPDRLPYDVKDASQLIGDRRHRARSFPPGLGTLP
ncbi:hypothetical protein SHJG_0520 [Streptomyces hygroscopicus subsp. jinggangensis 5008]|nr:hypothetical protein SHJG_0520 [Streptomyces hygroscopicus subsp. jinggangensis 5008]AGF60019.1 hypothetical protein SHJGH_0353 [Streptomyces hygroscopicus subsp. jinggangensis TL01]